MLTENQVVDAVCDYLTSRGYTISQRRHGRQPGDDIVAIAPSGVPLHVEAKGSTSGFGTSARAGQQFDSAQCQVHVAEAFFRAVAMRDAAPTGQIRRVAIALAALPHHDSLLARVARTLEQLEIGVFIVQPDSSVTFAGSWSV